MNIEERVREIAGSDFKTPLIIVLTTGVVAGVVGWVVSLKIEYIWPESLPFGQHWELIMGGSTLFSAIVTSVVTWLLIFGAVHVISGFFGGNAEAQQIFKVGGYIFLILLIGNIVAAVAVPLIPETTIDLSQIEEEEMAVSEVIKQTQDYQRSFGYLLYEAIITIFKGGAMIATILVAEVLYGYSRSRAAIACGIPYIVYILIPIFTIMLTLSL